MKQYTLYTNNCPTSIIEQFNSTLVNINPSIKFDIVEFNNNGIEPTRGIPPYGVSLYCHFISKNNLDYKTNATKIYNEGLGYGIGLLNVDVELYHKLHYAVLTFDEYINVLCKQIVNCVRFCENNIKFIDK